MIHRLRIYSGLVLFAFVFAHFANHAAGLVSLEIMEAGREFTIRPWRTLPGTLLLAGALILHAGTALWPLYRRFTLRMRRMEAVQIGLGLLSPILLAGHLAATRVAYETLDVQGSYALNLLVFWVNSPGRGVLQALALIVVWTHGCLGINAWLRLKPWYPAWRQAAYSIAILLPALALAGYVSAGMRVRDLAGQPGWTEGVLAATRSPENIGLFVDDRAALIRVAVLAILVALFTARIIRGLRTRSRAARLTYGDGRIINIRAGATVLEMLRVEDIPHASVCGGRGRCSTCRVRLGDGAGDLPPPSPAEQRVLDRIAAPAGVRLACQIRPTHSLAVTPLLPPTATAEDGFRRPRYLQGQEREIAVLFADMRGFTRLADGKLPYDVVFILNRYFEALGRAVEDANGRLDKFIGDGVMALFGIEAGAEAGCRRALVAARAMAARIDELNENLAHDLPQPLRIGVGIHVGPVIVGEMGYGKARSLTAIGDAVNIASRLESLTKDLSAFLVISEEVARYGSVADDDLPRREVVVRGRAEPMAIRIVASADDLARIIGPGNPP